jgi:hypothetical protein
MTSFGLTTPTAALDRRKADVGAGVSRNATRRPAVMPSRLSAPAIKTCLVSSESSITS